MKILSAQQIKWLDQYTINSEPISSIDLMERACEAFVDWVNRNIPVDSHFLIYAGPGNNGGDAIGIGRLLHQSSYAATIVLCHFGKSISKDCAINLERARKCDGLSIRNFDHSNNYFHEGYIIDGIFGSGITRKVEAPFNEVIDQMNQSKNSIISIDVPSGLQFDQSSLGPVSQAKKTLTFQTPKLCFLLPENDKFVGDWEVLDIGLSQVGLSEIETKNYYLENTLISSLYQPKGKFDHKGSNGSCLLVSGNQFMTGASVLNAKACLRAGSGLVTVHSVEKVNHVVQNSIAEILTSFDIGDSFITNLSDIKYYDAIGIGSGIGTEPQTEKAFITFLKNHKTPIVIDADALNIISKTNTLKFVPKKSILTPHPKEFERLFGTFENDFSKAEFLREFCLTNELIVVLKGAHSIVGTPDGILYFNSTGNPGMATAGSGDVLTGVITSLLGQNYSPSSAALVGVFVHGLAGDIALEKLGSHEGLIASDIIEAIPQAFSHINGI